jgi:aspartyl/asparaginyl-tRNA synthetase
MKMDLRIFMKECHDEQQEQYDSLPPEVRENIGKSQRQRDFDAIEDKWKRIRQGYHQ